MVLFSNKANQDLDDIYEGLLNWKIFQLERSFVIEYVVDIVDACATIDQTFFHADVQYPEHKEFGEKFSNTHATAIPLGILFTILTKLQILFIFNTLHPIILLLLLLILSNTISQIPNSPIGFNFTTIIAFKVIEWQTVTNLQIAR